MYVCGDCFKDECKQQNFYLYPLSDSSTHPLHSPLPGHQGSCCQPSQWPLLSCLLSHQIPWLWSQYSHHPPSSPGSQRSLMDRSYQHQGHFSLKLSQDWNHSFSEFNDQQQILLVLKEKDFKSHLSWVTGWGNIVNKYLSSGSCWSWDLVSRFCFAELGECNHLFTLILFCAITL